MPPFLSGFSLIACTKLKPSLVWTTPADSAAAGITTAHTTVRIIVRKNCGASGSRSLVPSIELHSGILLISEVRVQHFPTLDERPRTHCVRPPSSRTQQYLSSLARRQPSCTPERTRRTRDHTRLLQPRPWPPRHGVPSAKVTADWTRSQALATMGSAKSSSVGMMCSCLLYTSPSPRDRQKSRMPSSA